MCARVARPACRRYGLAGEVYEEQFARLAEGQHPEPAAVGTASNGAGVRQCQWRNRAHNGAPGRMDATFSAPKSVSLTALVGGDERVKKPIGKAFALRSMKWRSTPGAHRRQCTGRDDRRVGGAKFETTVAARWTATPRRSAHAHGDFQYRRDRRRTTRALQPQELYKTQQYATAVYRSSCRAVAAVGLRDRAREHGQPEIKGYTREYLEASSPRRQQITETCRAGSVWPRGGRRSRRTRRARRSSI